MAILAFNMFAQQLGFAIESVAASFPDRIAKRRLGAGRRQTWRTELAFRRDSFRDHGRDPDGLRPIVCRAHEWADCPLPSIEPTSAPAGLDASA